MKIHVTYSKLIEQVCISIKLTIYMIKGDTQERSHQQADLRLPMFLEKGMKISISINPTDNLRITSNENIIHLEHPGSKE